MEQIENKQTKNSNLLKDLAFYLLLIPAIYVGHHFYTGSSNIPDKNDLKEYRADSLVKGNIDRLDNNIEKLNTKISKLKDTKMLEVELAERTKEYNTLKQKVQNNTKQVFTQSTVKKLKELESTIKRLESEYISLKKLYNKKFFSMTDKQRKTVKKLLQEKELIKKEVKSLLEVYKGVNNV